MRQVHLLFGLSAFATMIGGIAAGCSGDDNKSNPATDASSSDVASSGGSSGGSSGSSSGGSSGSSSSGTPAAPDCGAPSGIKLESLDSGTNSWACFQQRCNASLAGCSLDTCCDNAILQALLCAQDAGLPSSAAAMTCFVNTGFFNFEAGVPLSSCLTTNQACCTQDAGCMPFDGGTTTPEAGGHEGGTDAGATEGGTDAGTSDAASGG